MRHDGKSCDVTDSVWNSHEKVYFKTKILPSIINNIHMVYICKPLHLPNWAFQHLEKNEGTLASLGRDFYIFLVVV